MIILLPFAYFRGVFRRREWARIIVMAAFLALAALIAAGSYVGFVHGFRFFKGDAFFGEALAAYSMEATFLIVAALVFASAVSSGISFYFGLQENKFIFSSPYPPFRLFFARFAQNAAFSLWPVLLIGFPALAAFVYVRSFSIAAISGFVPGLLAIFFIILALAALSDALIVRFFGILRGFGRLIAAVILLGGCAIVLGRVLVPWRLMQIFYTEDFSIGNSARSDLVFSNFRFSPVHQAVKFLFEPSAAGMIALAAIILAALAGFAVLWFFANRMYSRLLMRSAEGSFIARPEDAAKKSGRKNFPIIFNSAFGAMLEKDIITFFRSGRDAMRALSLVFMLLLYVVLFRRLPGHGLIISPTIALRLLAFDIAIIGYFATTLALRFVFPLFSLEGKSAWTLFASPVSRARIFRQKLAVGCTGILAVVAPLAVLSAGFLKLSGGAEIVFIFLVAMIAAVISALSLSFGALWPNFRDRDPDTLSTTMPGLLATAISLAVVMIGAYAGYAAFKPFYLGSAPAIVPFMIFAGFCVLIACVAAYFALRHLRQADIAL